MKDPRDEYIAKLRRKERILTLQLASAEKLAHNLKSQAQPEMNGLGARPNLYKTVMLHQTLNTDTCLTTTCGMLKTPRNEP